MRSIFVGLGIFGFIVFVAFIELIAVTCIIWAIFWAFGGTILGYTFSYNLAFGIWLIMTLLQAMLRR